MARWYDLEYLTFDPDYKYIVVHVEGFRPQYLRVKTHRWWRCRFKARRLATRIRNGEYN